MKQMKHLLYKTLELYKLTPEQLMTVLTEVEAILNSRPLAPMDSAPIDGEQALTPAHFLIGRSLKALPLPADESRPTHLLRRWVLCQRLNKEIWRKWSGEYTQTPLIRTPLTRAVEQANFFIHTYQLELFPLALLCSPAGNCNCGSFTRAAAGGSCNLITGLGPSTPATCNYC